MARQVLDERDVRPQIDVDVYDTWQGVESFRQMAYTCAA
jgi:hypothetical protein